MAKDKANYHSTVLSYVCVQKEKNTLLPPSNKHLVINKALYSTLIKPGSGVYEKTTNVDTSDNIFLQKATRKRHKSYFSSYTRKKETQSSFLKGDI